MKPIVFETFRRLGDYEKYQFTTSDPYCWNGEVSIRKYRVTIEEIKEPHAVLVSRLQKLWEDCDNHHHWEPLSAVAASLGVTLPSRYDITKRKASK